MTHPRRTLRLAPEEPADYWTGPINGPVPETLSGAKVTHTEALSALLKESNIVLVDVSNLPNRPEKLAEGAVWLPKPHQVIPGSLWIPGAGVGAIAPEVDATFRDRLAHATGNDMDRLARHLLSRTLLAELERRQASGPLRLPKRSLVSRRH